MFWQEWHLPPLKGHLPISEAQTLDLLELQEYGTALALESGLEQTAAPIGFPKATKLEILVLLLLLGKQGRERLNSILANRLQLIVYVDPGTLVI